MMVALVVAWRIDAEASAAPPGQVFVLTVVDERDAPVTGATVEYSDLVATTDENGSVAISLNAPELAIVRATGMLPDAVVVGDREAKTLELLATTGPGGDRTVMSFAGDFMMGRRFLAPETGDPLVTDDESARAVVEDIAPLFALADLSTVNLESVIGTLATGDAAAGKRYLLESSPATIAALDELGVDLVTLGNNHLNDWLGPGLDSTLRYLDEAGIAHAGAGADAAEAANPTLLSAGNLTVGVVSMTTVNGDYVNDNLPGATDPEPATIDDEDRWQYETRKFGFGTPGNASYVATELRRPGEMWRIFDDMEPDLSNGDAADLWRAMARVYPELQDWGARRGHGGAALFTRDNVATSIAAARAAGADLVVVQLHGGYQFAEVSSDYFGEATRTAVDAGADLVIGHHPHVLQGFEIYHDTLIAYSLGNFVFDQEFLATHPSVVLRTVFEGSEMVDATLYPVIIDGYRPVAATGDVADRILRQLNEASLQDAESLRLPDAWIGSTRTDAPVTAVVVNNQGRGSVEPIEATRTLPVAVSASVPVAVGALVEIGTATDELVLGRDVFGYGDLEDAQADGAAAGGLEWSVPPESLTIDLTSPEGPWVVRLDRTSQHLDDIVARTEARVSLPEHRWFNEDGSAADGPATHSVRVWGKRVGAGIPFVRVYFYEFDDTDPTREPDSTPLGSVDVQLPLVNDGQWHELWVELPEPPVEANAALVGVGLAPPESQSGTVWIDGLRVIEWRQANDIPEGTWVPVDYVMGPEYGDRTLVTAPG
jgi:poly-gamma-glutamate capsule biosynthesis protein CapA/YwtB (metallophosphatase superfamily)